MTVSPTASTNVADAVANAAAAIRDASATAAIGDASSMTTGIGAQTNDLAKVAGSLLDAVDQRKFKELPGSGVPDPRSNTQAEVRREVTGLDKNGQFEYRIAVDAGDGNDSVQVVRNADNSMDVTINGETVQLTPQEASKAVIRAGAGDDTISLIDNRVGFNKKENSIFRERPAVEGGTGSDTFSGDEAGFAVSGRYGYGNRPIYGAPPTMNIPNYENDTLNGQRFDSLRGPMEQPQWFAQAEKGSAPV